jgi:hypothetical protein
VNAAPRDKLGRFASKYEVPRSKLSTVRRSAVVTGLNRTSTQVMYDEMNYARDFVANRPVVAARVKAPTPPPARLIERNFGEHIKAHTPYCNITEYPYCCGIKIINRLGTDLATFKKDIPLMVRRGSSVGILTVAINQNQVGLGFDKVLERYGFRRVAMASNPVHGDETVVSLYVREVGAKSYDVETGKQVK